MKTGWALLLLCLTACSASHEAEQIRSVKPVRIVSLDYCADQYVLKFASREQIAAVSMDAAKSFSYMRTAAQGVPTVRPTVEDVLALRPDVIVRSYGGGIQAPDMFRRAGIEVVQIGFADDLNAIRRTVSQISKRLGHPDRGQAVIQEMDSALSSVQANGRHPRALYVTSGGVTTGPGSLVDELMSRAGLANDQKSPGWYPISLERVVYHPPDMTVAAFFDASSHGQIWSIGTHPVLTRLRQTRPTVPIEGAWTSCGGWFVVEAVKAMDTGRRKIGAAP